MYTATLVYGTVLMHSNFAQSAALAADDPPALAHGKTALLWRTLVSRGATLLPQALKAMPQFASPHALNPEACMFVSSKEGGALGNIKNYTYTLQDC